MNKAVKLNIIAHISKMPDDENVMEGMLGLGIQTDDYDEAANGFAVEIYDLIVHIVNIPEGEE